MVWQSGSGGPPEWVLFELQGELQHKGAVGQLQKKGATTTFDDVATFDGIGMGILSPHVEHGPTQPELRIGNLVVPGRLKKLPKPLLVLTSVKTDTSDDAHMDKEADKKRRRAATGEDTEDASAAGSAQKKARSDGGVSSPPAAFAGSASSSASASDADFPTSYLQTVAVIRHKYVFAQRPFSICEVQAPLPTRSEKAAKAEAASQFALKAH